MEQTNAVLAKNDQSFEPWMFDEGEVVQATASRHARLLQQLKQANPPRSDAPLQAVREALKSIPILYVSSEDDTSFGFPAQKEQFDKLADPTMSQFIPVAAGGHGAVFQREKAQMISAWLRQADARR